MSGAHEAEFEHHVRTYIRVFLALMGLTILTVGAKYLNIPIVSITIFIALAIASVKASLVALFFMHLSAERRIIYVMLVLMILCVVGLFLLPTGMLTKPINGTGRSPYSIAKAIPVGSDHEHAGEAKAEEAPAPQGGAPAAGDTTAAAAATKGTDSGTRAATPAASSETTAAKGDH